MASRESTTEDEYIAQILAREAKEASKKYSELGVRALLPTRPTTAAPKPNTRFLKNIIRETDNHNFALKQKEQLEARLRLRAVDNVGPATSDRRERDDERRRKRRRVDDDADYDRHTNRHRRRSNRSRRNYEDGYNGLTRPEVEEERSRERRQYSRDKDHNVDVGSRDARHRCEEQHRSSHQEKRSSRLHDLKDEEKPSQGHRRKKRQQSSSRESNTSTERSQHRQRRKHHGYRTHGERLSPALDRSRSPQRKHRPKRSPTPSDANVRSATTRKNAIPLVASPDSDSDPLEALVGPLPPTSISVNDSPPLRSRGRGAYKPSASAIDQHFSSTYNPSLDLHPDSEPEEEKEDWDMALEALRDREIWKQKGAERLRAAGFGDEEIKKWEDSRKEKGAEDVKWTGKGEAREWDRGKVVEEAYERKGEVGLEAAWKRKGGGFLKDFKKALG